MTEQLRNTQSKDHKLRNRAGLAVTGALGLAIAFGAGGAFSPKETAKGDNYSPTPTSGEMATPRPSDAAGTPEPTAESVEVQNFTVEKLGTFEVLPGDIIAGDVSISDTADSAIFPLYDQDTHKAADVEDNTKTALYVDVQAPGVVHAEWGATVTRGLTAEQKAEMLKLQAISKERAGFDKVDVVIWTGYDTTVDEAGFKADKTEGSNPDDTENPTVDNLDNLSNQDKMRIILDLIAEGKVNGTLTVTEEAVLMDILINCLCGCANPEEPKPTPSSTPEACPDKGYADHLYEPKDGPFKVTTNGVLIRGDATVNGKAWHDTLGETEAVSWIWTDTPKAYTVSGRNEVDVLWTTCPSKDIFVEQVNIAVQQEKDDPRPLDKNVVRKGL